MKKLILLVCFISSSLATMAQKDTKIEPLINNGAKAFSFKPYRFSIAVTPIISWLRPEGTNLSSKGARAGIGGGLLVEKNITENVSLGSGIFITQMGGKLGYDSLVANSNPPGNSISNVEYTYKTRYVDIPLLVKLRTDEFGYNRVFFEVGFAFSFLWRARADLDKDVFSNQQGGNKDRLVNNNDGDFVVSRSVVSEDDIFPVRIPLIFGAGWEYALSTNTVFFAGLRYNAGITNSMSAKSTKAIGNHFGLNIGIMF